MLWSNLKKIAWTKTFLLTCIICSCLFFGSIVHAEEITFADGEIVVNLTTIPDGVVTMHAIWDVADITLQTPTKPGYTFDGWYSDANCTDDSFIGNAGDPYLPTSATIVLYAKWAPKTYTVIFDLNDAYTETANYALYPATCSTTSKDVEFDQPYGTLPVPVRTGYDFLGWYTTPSEGSNKKANEGTKITESTRYTVLNADGTDGADQVLYARWKNNDPINVKMEAIANNSSMGNLTYTIDATIDMETPWINVPTDFFIRAEDHGDSVKEAWIDVLSSNTDSENPIGTFGSAIQYYNESVTAGFGLLETEGTTVLVGHVKDKEDTQTNRIDTGNVTTGEMTVKLDTTKPIVTQFDVLVGTNRNPLNTTSTQSYIGREVYNSLAYGSKIDINVTDKNETLADATDVSKIKYMWLRIYDTDNYDASTDATLANSNYRDYELIANNYNQLTASYQGIIDTNVDFMDVLNLSYELHVIDVAGNETIVTETYNRIPEVFAKIERITVDPTLVNGEFLAGYRGRLHIFTTGWVDEVELEWPDCIVKSALYDRDHDEEYMEYNVAINMVRSDIMTFMLNEDGTDPNLFYLDADGENTTFIRCYTFDFWIPLYLMHENNPDRLVVPEDGCVTLPIVTTAIKRIQSYTSGTMSVISVVSDPISALFTIGHGSIIDSIRTSILN